MLNKSHVQHVANLAKLKITDEEAEKYSGELSKVLLHVDELQNVGTAGVASTLVESRTLKSLRADEIKDWSEEEKQTALQQAEVGEDGLVKVPKII